MLIVPDTRIVDAFTEWDRRYRAEPEMFQSDVEHLLGNTPQSYGEGAAAYFHSLLMESGPSKQYAPGLVEKMQRLVDEYGFAGVQTLLNDHETIRL